MNSGKSFEVIVIGGGIIGASISYFLSKKGFSVAVLEKNEIASGTSSRCDGNILAIDKDPGFDSQLTLKSQQLTYELQRELDFPFEYRNYGSILVCENESEMIQAEKWVKKQNQAGLDFNLLDREDLKNESKYLADDLYGGVECKTDSTVNPYLFTYALIQGAQRNSAKIFTNTEVVDIKKDKENYFRIYTDQGIFLSAKVINACGIWAPDICKMLDINIPIVPRKGQIIVASRQELIGYRKVMEFGYLMSKFNQDRNVDDKMKDHGIALVYEPTENQNFLIGSSREFRGFDLTVDYSIIRLMAKRALRFYPKISDMTCIRTYAGLRPWTPDHLPIISSVDKIPGFYIAAGHEGDGISLAAITGKLITEIVEGITPSVSLELLRYDRFDKGVFSY